MYFLLQKASSILKVAEHGRFFFVLIRDFIDGQHHIIHGVTS